MKNKQWTIKEKTKIVKEHIDGASITFLQKKYNIKSNGTVTAWKKEYLANDESFPTKKKGRKTVEFDEVEVLKKSYALLMKIRSGQL